MTLAYDPLSEFHITNFLKIIYEDCTLELIRNESGYLYQVKVSFQERVIKVFNSFPEPGSTENILFQVLNKANKIHTKLNSSLNEYYKS